MQPQIDDTSKTFVEQLQNEHAQAWGIFERVYAKFIRNILVRNGVRESDLDDVCQSVLIAVSRGVGGFEFRPQRASFRAWLKTVTVNRARDHLRKSAKKLEANELFRLDDFPSQICTADEDEKNRQELGQLYERAIAELSNYFRRESVEIFISLMKGSSVSQLAEETGKSAAAIRQTKVRILHRLREIAGE